MDTSVVLVIKGDSYTVVMGLLWTSQCLDCRIWGIFFIVVFSKMCLAIKNIPKIVSSWNQEQFGIEGNILHEENIFILLWTHLKPC